MPEKEQSSPSPAGPHHNWGSHNSMEPQQRCGSAHREVEGERPCCCNGGWFLDWVWLNSVHLLMHTVCIILHSQLIVLSKITQICASQNKWYHHTVNAFLHNISKIEISLLKTSVSLCFSEVCEMWCVCNPVPKVPYQKWKIFWNNIPFKNHSWMHTSSNTALCINILLHFQSCQLLCDVVFFGCQLWFRIDRKHSVYWHVRKTMHH